MAKKTPIDTFNPPDKEEEGQVIPRHQIMRRKEPGAAAETVRDSEATNAGLDADGSAGAKQNTPGRPKSASSRQQTQPAQATQTGSAQLDSSGAKKRK